MTTLRALLIGVTAVALPTCAPRAHPRHATVTHTASARPLAAGTPRVAATASDGGSDTLVARSPLRWRRYAIGDFYFEAPETIALDPSDAVDSRVYSMRAGDISIDTDSMEAVRVENSQRTVITLGSITAQLEIVETDQGRSATLHLPPTLPGPPGITTEGRRHYVAALSGELRTVHVQWLREAQREIGLRIVRSVRREPPPPDAVAPPQSEAFAGVQALQRYVGTVGDGAPNASLAQLAADRLGAAITREPNHPEALWWMWRRVEALVALERHRDVIAVAAQARATMTTAQLRHRFNTTNDLLLAEVVALSRMGEYPAALERARELMNSMQPLDQELRVDVRGWLAELLARAGRDEEAHAEFRQIRFGAVLLTSLADRLRRVSAEVDARLRERRRAAALQRRDAGR